MATQDELNQALAIVGAEDFSTDGVNGLMTIKGEFAHAIIKALRFAPEYEQRLLDKPVRLSRNGQLEIWCDGWYTEGSGCRRIIHAAVRSLQMKTA